MAHCLSLSSLQILTAAVVVGLGYGTALIQQNDGSLTAIGLAMYGTVAFNATMSIKQV